MGPGEARQGAKMRGEAPRLLSFQALAEALKYTLRRAGDKFAPAGVSNYPGFSNYWGGQAGEGGLDRNGCVYFRPTRLAPGSGSR